MINIYINNIKLKLKENITILQACNKLKIEIPKFCFQENLQIAGNCRMCLVEIKNFNKPITSCSIPITNNMKIFTNTSLIRKARENILEFLLINHPLDCPICDQASECDLQNQSFIFGLDKTRFFFKKKVVEDIYKGSLIKTIMTRCIYCTRCIRFSNEICNIDNLCINGRGNKIEINFYLKNIFNSEFSGNLIDLCPVGALTSKTYIFKNRYWDLEKKNGIDILDSFCSNINIDIYNNEIVRILPKNNFKINKEWISNTTRFFFDSLKYQRINEPLIKKNKKFKKISWYKTLNIINKKLILIDSFFIKIIIGNLVDLQSLFYFKKLLNNNGISNIIFENKNYYVNTDLTYNFLFNNNLNNLLNIDVCLIINLKIIEENPILNLHLINRLKKKFFILAYIGHLNNFTYPIKNLGLTINILIKILLGKNFFCKNLIKSKNPLIIFNENIINQKNGWFLLSKFKNLKIFKNKNINFLNSTTSFINFLEINFNNSKKKNQKSKLLYLFNTNLKKIKKKNQFIIYQGHHFTKNSEESNLLLPGLTFLEKDGIFINFQGLILKNNKILNYNIKQKKDSIIFKYINIFILNKNKLKKKQYISLKKILPYLKKKQIKILLNNYINKKILKMNIQFFNCLIKNFYYKNILEKYSKNLINYKKNIKNYNNFINNY